MRYNRRMLRATRLVLVLTLAAAPAGAQAKPDFEAAKKHYLAGKSAAAAADYDAAIREYILAYDITKDPALFKQIGTAYEAEGKKTEAAVYYRRYLVEVKGSGDVDEVRARLAAIEGKPTEPARQPSPLPPPSPGEPPPAPAKLPPPESPTAAPPEMQLSQPPLPTFADEGSRWERTAAWISVGLAAIGVTTGSVLATSALAREDDLRQLVEYRDPLTGLPRVYGGAIKDDYKDKIDEGNRLQTFATAAFVSAGVCAAAATVFFILDATRSVPKERVSMHPYLDLNSAGVRAAWEF
jgi:tetratricopeptide (TPR) repeat protein